MWSKKYCDSNGQNLSEVLKGFLDYIHFHMIPANVLMKEINPLGIVPHCIIMNALAYQADPSSVEPMKPSAVKEVRHTGIKINFLSKNYQEFDVWKMRILWKMRFQNCEFCEKWDFRNVNFVKNEISEMWILWNEISEIWILWKLIFQKCEFFEKWDFRIVYFVKIAQCKP